MASVRINGSAEDLRTALGIFGTIADEYESGGVPTDELWPRLAAAEQHVDEFRSRVRQRIREAAG